MADTFQGDEKDRSKMTMLETMKLGKTGIEISRLGMGCWAIGGHGWGNVNDEDSIRAVKCALDKGVTFFDTADTYGLGKSETLLSSILGDERKNVIIASKGGVRWDESGKVWTDLSPAYLREAVENSLRRLKLDCIPLYYIHKHDGLTPIQDVIAVLTRMQEEGKIGAIGVANFNADQLLQALQVTPIAAAQLRFNIFDRQAAKKLMNVCQENNITLVAWGALADGLLTGKFKTITNFSADDHRSRMAEFVGDTFSSYAKCVELLEQLSLSLGHKLSHLALRWVLDFAPFACSLFGAKTDKQVQENIGADGWKLTKKSLQLIDSMTETCWR